MHIVRQACLVITTCTVLVLGADRTAHASPWAQVGADVFGVQDGVYRTQGMATDGTDFYFSWQYGLEKTDGRTMS
jgi:hypothetical protein